MKTRLVLLLPVLALTACKDNTGSVIVAGLCAPPTDAKTCSYAATCSANWLGDVAIDLDATNRLRLVMQVDNQLPDNSDANAHRTNTNDAYVRGFEVDVPALGTFSAPLPGSGFVPAGGSTVVDVPIVNPAMVTGLTGLVAANGYADFVTKLRLKIALADTTEFNTADYQVTVRVCRSGGCAPTTAALPACPTGQVRFSCPGSLGQLPLVTSCSTP